MTKKTSLAAALSLVFFLGLPLAARGVPLEAPAKPPAAAPAPQAAAQAAALAPAPAPQAAPASRAVLELKETLYDFGTVMEGGSLEHAFEVRNTGQDELVIRSVRPG